MSESLATPMERAPVPDLGTAPIPKERYTSPDFARLEWEKMWTKVWLLAGRESDIPAPGDYFTFEIGPESILVIRQPDGSIGARYNVCMHRGNRLREPGRGHAELFSCLLTSQLQGKTERLQEAREILSSVLEVQLRWPWLFGGRLRQRDPSLSCGGAAC